MMPESNKNEGPTEQQIQITAMLGVLAEKAERQKRRISKMLAKPKKERNRDYLKKMLKENKYIRKSLKKVQNKVMRVWCPNCDHSFNITLPDTRG